MHEPFSEAPMLNTVIKSANDPTKDVYHIYLLKIVLVAFSGGLLLFHFLFLLLRKYQCESHVLFMIIFLNYIAI